MFSEMFFMPSGENQQQSEGFSEDKPIVLLLGAEPEFDLFVSQAYGL
jgi:hypothetical protein